MVSFLVFGLLFFGGIVDPSFYRRADQDKKTSYRRCLSLTAKSTFFVFGIDFNGVDSFLLGRNRYDEYNGSVL